LETGSLNANCSRVIFDFTAARSGTLEPHPVKAATRRHKSRIWIDFSMSVFRWWQFKVE